MVDLTSEREEKIRQIVQKYDLDLLLLFGSQVTGKTHKESDYDIGYMAKRTLDLDDEGMLINDLVSIVGARDERLVNLVNAKKAGPLLLYAMTKQAQVLYEKDPVMFAALRAYAFKKYVETKRFREEKARRIRERIMKL